MITLPTPPNVARTKPPSPPGRPPTPKPTVDVMAAPKTGGRIGDMIKSISGTSPSMRSPNAAPVTKPPSPAAAAFFSSDMVRPFAFFGSGGFANGFRFGISTLGISTLGISILGIDGGSTFGFGGSALALGGSTFGGSTLGGSTLAFGGSGLGGGGGAGFEAGAGMEIRGLSASISSSDGRTPSSSSDGFSDANRGTKFFAAAPSVPKEGVRGSTCVLGLTKEFAKKGKHTPSSAN